MKRLRRSRICAAFAGGSKRSTCCPRLGCSKKPRSGLLEIQLCRKPNS